MAFSRPVLSVQKQAVYEDDTRSSRVLEEMHRFYQDQRFCDIILCVDGCRFPCHRIVLAASSVYFERMFSNGMSEANAKEVTLNDLTPNALQYLIEFAYTSKLVVTCAHALDIFEAADMLQFPTAKSFCEEFLTELITAQNCLNFMLYADAYSCKRLYDKAKLCAAGYFKVLCTMQCFLELPSIHVHTLLKEDSIEMEYEEHMYEAMRQWVMFEPTNRRALLPDLFKCIRLNFVSRWYLIEVISKDPLLLESNEARVIMQRAKDQLLAQGHTYEIPWQLPPSRKCTGMTEKIVYLNTHDPNPGESEVILFDVVNKSWSSISKQSPFASEMSTFCHLGDALLVIGGWTNSVGSLNQRGAVNMVHEFKAMTIFPTLWYNGAHQMGIARYLHSSVVVGNKLYLMGGLDDTQSLQATMYVTDQEHRYQFEVCPRMLYPVCRAAVAAYDNKIFVFGGFCKDGTPIHFVQQFDVNTQKWSETTPIEGLNTACQYATCIGNLIYVLCGNIKETVRHSRKENPMVGHTVPPKFLDSMRTFNPLTQQWKHIYKFKTPLMGSFCVTTLDGRIYITGGEKNNAPHMAVDCYDPESNKVETVGNCKEGSFSLCSTMKIMHENFGL